VINEFPIKIGSLPRELIAIYADFEIFARIPTIELNEPIKCVPRIMSSRLLKNMARSSIKLVSWMFIKLVSLTRSLIVGDACIGERLGGKTSTFIFNSRETDVVTESPYKWGLYATLWDTFCRFKTVKETICGKNSTFSIREDVMVDLRDFI
jgi:hypothetical protein